MKKNIFILSCLVLTFSLIFSSFKTNNITKAEIHKNSRIVLLGNNLGSRMMNYGHFETEMHLRYPQNELFIRNMCDGGDTPGFRPHSARNSPWAFPGAEKFQSEFTNYSNPEGHFDTPDQWLTNLKPDVLMAFFGLSESYQGKEGLENYKAELEAFIKHTLSQKYNGIAPPRLVLISPTAFEDLSLKFDLPNGIKENENIELYSNAMKAVAEQNNLLFIDAFTESKSWYQNTVEDLTIDGLQLNEAGYKKLATFLTDSIFGKSEQKAIVNQKLIHEAVQEKNWMWHNDIKVPNGVHVYGRRYNPFGNENYPAEIQKIREMTAIRDSAIWMAASQGIKMDIAASDKKTKQLVEIKTNYNPDQNGSLKYLSGEEAIGKIKMAEGYKIELFASEEQFPDMAKPVQMTFDNKGRLWVATMPSYPHYKPGDAKPNDKLLILEDTNNDGKADKQTVFADGLHVPVGFEISHDGVYVSQGTNLILLKDLNDDDHADTKEIILSGFDDHDTHHTISAFVADPSGAFYMGEGVFLHTNVETPYGTVRATNGGFYRYSPQRRHLERVAQLAIPNPWGIAFDNWGQDFFAETSGPDVYWMMPGTVLNRYGEVNPRVGQLIEDAQKVRPTSGLEFIASRHFPDAVQGDMLINNTIGFLGMKQHQMIESGTGYKTKFRHDLIVSADKNFRPVDMEFAPDGSLYVIDWHNILIGHMQHNARDPLRDHSHGRVYRVTYPSRPLIVPAKVAGASIEQLLENLKLPEYRTKYRTKRELRGRNPKEVLAAITKWTTSLNKKDANYEHHLLEALWVSWGLNQVEQKILNQLLKAKDFRARAAAVKILRYTGHQVKNQADLLMAAVKDPNGRVRLEAFVAASWLKKEIALPILAQAAKMPLDEWMKDSYETALAHVNGENASKKKEAVIASTLKGKDLELFEKGKKIYAKEGYCITCHQSTGNGLSPSGFPPLAGTPWVTGDEERLSKIILKGLMGPIKVLDKNYDGQVPMTPFGGLLNDEEVAAVGTYIRNSFGNKASALDPEKVKIVRAKTDDVKEIYSSKRLLIEHPF
jgi:mono/diheme cytochrome c family protein/glucose/arabinose dehydrogenase